MRDVRRRLGTCTRQQSCLGMQRREKRIQQTRQSVTSENQDTKGRTSGRMPESIKRILRKKKIIRHYEDKGFI